MFAYLGSDRLRRTRRRPGFVLAAALVLTVLAIVVASGLRVRAAFSNLLPPEHPAVRALEDLRDTIGAETTAAVLIESPSVPANRAFAEALIPRVAELRNDRGEPYFTRVEYRRDPGFLRDNALYLATDEELGEVRAWLEELIVEASQEANPFFVDLTADLEPEGEANGGGIERVRELYDSVVPPEYPESEDGRVLVLRLYVAGSQTDFGFLAGAYAALQHAIDELDPSSFGAAMTVELGGRVRRNLVEVETIRRDLRDSLGVGVFTVLTIVGIFFLLRWRRVLARTGGGNTWSLIALVALTPVVIGLPLAMSLSWTGAIAWLLYGQLNLMTSTLGLVLFGLGIDYGVHLFGRYLEERAAGREAAPAIDEAITSTGPAIAVSALTTAAALFALCLAEFRGFSEFGGIAGTGILMALVATLTVLPALLLIVDRTGLVGDRDAAEPGASPGRSGFPAAGPVAALGAMLVLMALLQLPALAFEYDFGSLQPSYPELLRLDRKERLVYRPSGRNPAYVLVDSPAEAVAVAATLRERIARGESPTVERVELLQDRLPSNDEARARRLARLAEIRAQLEDPILAGEQQEDLDRLRRASQTRAALTVEQIPDYLRKRFEARDGSVGNYVIVYPAEGLSDGRAAMRFEAEVADFTAAGGDYRAASSALVAAAMLRSMLTDAPWIVALTALVIAVVMLATFRSLRWAALAILPLATGFLLMLGIAAATGLRLNFYNLVVLPAVLGIGNDCGVHIVHRYREEGPGSIMAVLRSTAGPIAVGALTTMVGFAGLLLSHQPGLRSMGVWATLGIGSTLAAALLLLPAVLQLIERGRSSR